MRARGKCDRYSATGRKVSAKLATYVIRRHQMIRTGDARYRVAVQESLDEPLDPLVHAHESHVSGVKAEQEPGLPPDNVIIQEEENESYKANAIERAVAEQRPPREREDRFAEQRAHADDEQNVEDRRADDGADSHVVERDEYPDDTCEQFRSTASGRHERGAGHVVRDAELFDDHVERRHEKLVAYDGQRDEHVDHAEHVEYDGAALPFLFREQIRREERLRFFRLALVARTSVAGTFTFHGALCRPLRPIRPAGLVSFAFAIRRVIFNNVRLCKAKKALKSQALQNLASKYLKKEISSVSVDRLLSRE